jgi:hypothetical protein
MSNSKVNNTTEEVTTDKRQKDNVARLGVDNMNEEEDKRKEEESEGHIQNYKGHI